MMTTNDPYIDVQRHPIGYITGFEPDILAENPNKDHMYEKLTMTLLNIPDAANITFHMELLNSQIGIYSRPAGVDIIATTSQKNQIHHTFPIPSAVMQLEYNSGNQNIIGELVRIKYTGLSLGQQNSYIASVSVKSIYYGDTDAFHFKFCHLLSFQA